MNRFPAEDFVKLVVDSGRTGFYFSVLEEGLVTVGDRLNLVSQDSHRVSIDFANHIYHHDRKNRNGIEKVLAVPALSESWKKSFLELKEKA